MKIKPFTLLALVFLSCPGAQFSTARAQGTMFTYQGRVTDNGTNFTGTGLFKFALVTATNTASQATATAVLAGGGITGYNLTYGGSGYLTPPAVTVSGGGGSGASAHTTVSGGSVTGVFADNAGSGYTSTPTVTIDPPLSGLAYTTQWSNDGTSVNGGEPAAAVSVGVGGGLFTVRLGDATTTNMTAINPAVFVQTNLLLRIWFDDGVNGSHPLLPLQPVTPAPYASVAGLAGSASNLLGALPASQLSGTVPLARLPVLPLTNNQAAVSLGGAFNGSFSGDGSGLSGVVKNYSVAGPAAGNIGPTGGSTTFIGPTLSAVNLAVGQTVQVSVAAVLGTTASSLGFYFGPSYTFNGGATAFMAGTHFLAPITTSAAGRQIYSQTLTMTIATNGSYVFGCGLQNLSSTNLNNNDYVSVSALVFK